MKERYISLYQSIYITECYGSGDLIELELLEEELSRRRYRIPEQPLIVKDEEG